MQKSFKGDSLWGSHPRPRERLVGGLTRMFLNIIWSFYLDNKTKIKLHLRYDVDPLTALPQL